MRILVLLLVPGLATLARAQVDEALLAPDAGERVIAGFVDAGIAWTESRDFALKRARAGGGVGLRLLNPFASVVRLDLGWSPEGGLRFHFAAGLKSARQRERLR